MAEDNVKDDGLNVTKESEDKEPALDPKEIKKAENEKQAKKILIISGIVTAVILVCLVTLCIYKISSDIKARRGEIVFFNGNNMYTDGTFSNPLHSDKVDVYSARSGYVDTDGKYLYYMENGSLYYDSLNSEKENIIADNVDFFEVDKKGHIYYLAESDLYEYTVKGGGGIRNLLYNNVRMVNFDEKKEKAILVLNNGTMGTLELKSSAQFNALDEGVTYVVDYDSKLQNIVYCKGNVLDVMDKKGNKLIVADSFSEVYPVDITKGVELYYLDNSDHLYYCKSATSSKGVTDVADFSEISGIYCDMDNREAFLVSGTVDGVTGVYLISEGKAERVEDLPTTSVDYTIGLDTKSKKIYFTAEAGDGNGKCLYSVSYGAFKKPKAVVEQNSVDSILGMDKGKLYTLRVVDGGKALYFNNGEVVSNIVDDTFVKTLDEKGYMVKYKTSDGEIRIGYVKKGSFKDLSYDMGSEYYPVSSKKIYMIRISEEGATSLSVFNGRKVKDVAEDVTAYTYIHY